jgi:predicted MFS family arabinose efflux permease
VGLLVSGQLAAVNWRLGFWWLAAVGLILGVAVATTLREPVRGGSSSLAGGASGIMSAEDPERMPASDRRSVLSEVRYVLSIRTSVLLVVGSSFGYFFMAGLSTFGVALLRGQFQIGQSLATLLIVVLGVGALAGVLSTGRIADWLMTRGYVSARMGVGGLAFLAAATFILPTLLTHNLALAIVFAFLAAIALGGVNPPLNAARLDIVHSRLWGTAEAVRTTLVSISTGLAPLVFGLVSTKLSGSNADVGGAGEIAPSAANALGHTFLIMLAALLIGAVLILCVATRTYPRDVATAMASESVTATAAVREPAGRAAGTGLWTLQPQ